MARIDEMYRGYHVQVERRGTKGAYQAVAVAAEASLPDHRIVTPRVIGSGAMVRAYQMAQQAIDERLGREETTDV